MISTLTAQTHQFRKDILTMVHAAQSGHIGGPFSAIDFLTGLFFGKCSNGDSFLKYSQDPTDPTQDYFILSKSHCSPAMYAILGEIGYISKDEYTDFRKLGSRLQGHVTSKVPGALVSGGSLGQGLSLMNGMALAFKTDNKPNKIWTMFGDGEMQEGQIWEAVMTAAHFKLSNIRAIIDRNNIQIDGRVEDIMNIGDIAQKFEAFGWSVIEIKDGNDMKQVIATLEKVKSYTENKPLAIISHTIKGKGVSFMEDTAKWHGSAPNDEQFAAAIAELNNKI